MGSHSSPHRDPTPGRQTDAERAAIWLFAAALAFIAAAHAAHTLGWIQ